MCDSFCICICFCIKISIIYEYVYYVYWFLNSKLLDDIKEVCGKGYYLYYLIYIFYIDILI